MKSEATFQKSQNRLWVIICLAIPGIFLTGAYIHMCLFHEKLWLFNIVVHERGKYTLLEVILYFRHFLWEVLIKVVYSLFIVGTFYYYGKPVVRINESPVSNIPAIRILISAVFALGIVVVSVLMAANQVSYKEAVVGLFQYRTHELRPLQFGSHWRNHFLSNIVLFSASAFFILLYRMVTDDGYWVKRRFSYLLPVSLWIFVLFTFFFGLTMDPFETPSYLGHQLREIFGTDLSITMFLTMGALIHLEGRYDAGKVDREIKYREHKKNNFLRLFALSLPVILITGFLIRKVLSLNISSEIAKLGGTKGWSTLDLFAWHFFEHSLDYVFAVSLVYCLYLLTLRIELRRGMN